MKKITFWLFLLLFSLQLNAQTGTLIIGINDGTPNTTTGYPSPFQDYYKTGRAQYLYLASELSAAGLVAGPITDLGWVVTSIGTSGLEEGYTISMKNTTSTVLTTTFESGASIVYGPIDFTPSSTGNVVFPLTNPFVWDGNSNIIVEICSGSSTGTYTQNVQCSNSTLLFNGSNYFRSDTSTSPCTVTTATSTSTSRPLLVLVGNVSTCLAPLNLVSSSITSNSANISWDSSTSSLASGYEYSVSTSSSAPSGTGVSTTNSYVALINLLPNTTYYLFVRTNCGGSFSGWGGPISFTTACGAVNTYPFIETFNTDSTSKACWSVINGNADANSWSLNGTTIPRSGQSAQLYTDFASSNNDYLVSPQFNLGTTPKRLKFWVRHYSNAEPDNLEIKISTGGKTIPDFTTTLLSLSTTQITTTYTEYIIDLTPYTGLVYIAFARENAPADGWYIAVDDVTVENIPTCTEPSGLVSSSITAYTANVSWNAPSSAPALGYQYVLSTTNTVPTGSGTDVSNSYAALSSLTANTTYYFFVRSYCSSSDSSPWIGPISFTTACAPVTTFPVLEPFNTFLPSACWIKGDNGDLTTGPATFGTNGFYSDGFGNVGTTGSFAYNIWMAAANDWIISPEYSIPTSGYELKFDAAAANYGATTAVTNWEADDFVEVLVSSTGTTNWTVLYTYNNSNVPAPTGTTNVIDLDSYAGQSVRFAYRVVEGTNNGAADLEFFIDNFQIRLSPTCPDMTGLVVSGVTAFGANTSWNDMSNGGALGYEYAVTTSATPPTSGTATTSTFYVASGLSPQTVYYLHVRATCSSGVYGNWSTITFTTACAPITALPWNEGFEGLTTVGTTNFPSCWFKENGDWASQNTNGTYSAANTGTKYIRNSWSATNEYIWTPGFDLVAGTSYDFSSFIQGDNGTGWAVDYFVNTTQNSTGATQIGSTYNVPGTGSTYAAQAYNKVTATFVPTTTGTYYFAVRVNQPSSSPWYVSFDDFALELTPACPSPNSNTITSLTPTSATITWNTTSGAYEYVIDNLAANPTTAGTAITTNTYSPSSLTPNTVYYVHVRSNCNGSLSPWYTFMFTTPLVPPANDNCSGAIVLTPGATFNTNPLTANLTGATNSNPPAPGCASFAGGDVWYSVVVPASGSITIETGGTFTGGDTGMAVYSGTCGNLVLVSCDDDSSSNGSYSLISLTNRTAGEILYVNTWQYNTGVSTISYQISAYDASLSSSSFDMSSFVAYPNPVKDVLNLSYSSTITNVKVTNLLGQQVINKNVNDTNVQVNMADLAVGTYIVNISSGDLIHTIKVIKQ